MDRQATTLLWVSACRDRAKDGATDSLAGFEVMEDQSRATEASMAICELS